MTEKERLLDLGQAHIDAVAAALETWRRMHHPALTLEDARACELVKVTQTTDFLAYGRIRMRTTVQDKRPWQSEMFFREYRERPGGLVELTGEA